MEIGSAFVSILPSMRGFGRQLRQGVSRDVEQTGREEGKHFGRSFGGAVAAAGGAIAAGAFIKNSIGLEAAFSKTLNTMGAVANVPKDQLKDLSALAIKMGADTTFSANEAADAMLELAKGGISAAQIKAGALAGTLTLAAAGGTDLGTAATIASNAMNTFALKGKDMGTIAAALAGGANASSASVESLGQGLSQVGPGARNAGLSLYETVGALSAFDAAGIKGSDAGTSLKTMLAALVPKTDKAKAAMADLGLNFVKSNGDFQSLTNISEQLRTKLSGLSEAQRSTALTTIFGSDASRAATVLMNEGAKGINGYIKATKDQNAAQRAADAAMKGTAGALETLSGSWETVQLQVGQLLAPVIQHGALFLADALGRIFPAGQKAAAALAPLVSTVKSSVGDIAKAFNILFEGGSIKGRIDGFAEVMDHAFGNSGNLVTPIRAIATAIHEIIPAVKQIIPVVQAFGVQAIAVFRDQVLPVLQQARNTFMTVLLPAITALVSYLATSLWPVFLQVAGVIRNNLIPIISTFASFFYTTLYPAVVRIVSAIAHGLKPAFDQLVATFRTSVLPSLQLILVRFHQWQPTIQRVISVIVAIIGKLLVFAAVILGKVLPIVIRFAGWLLTKLVPAILNTIGFIARLIGAAVKIATPFVNAQIAVVKFAAKVVKKVAEVIKTVSEIPGKVVSALGDLGSTLVHSGEALISGFARGIRNKATEAYDEAKNMLGKIKNLFPHSPAKEGPFSGRGWVLYSGRAISEALAKGISDKAPHAVKAAFNLVSRVKDRIDTIVDSFHQLSDSIAGTFTNGLFDPTTGGDFLAGLTAKRAELTKLVASFKKLVGWGLSPNFLSSLFQSGNGALILDLASGSAAQARNDGALFTQVQGLAGQLGNAVATDVYGPQIVRELQSLAKAVDRLPGGLGGVINGTASKGRRKSR